MKVFVAGATGAVGKPLLARLVSTGYDVVAMTRSPDKAQAVHDLYPGVVTVVADGLDRKAIIDAVMRTGPGTSIAAGGAIVEAIRKRQFPVVGNGAGVWSFAHVADVASATVAAIERGAPGVYNVCDDEPAPVSVWLPELARAIGAKPPWRVPVWLGRLFAGEAGVSMMTRIRGASNAKAKRELGWQPEYATWRDGFLRLELPLQPQPQLV